MNLHKSPFKNENTSPSRNRIIRKILEDKELAILQDVNYMESENKQVVK